jgi:hypothetical protein
MCIHLYNILLFINIYNSAIIVKFALSTALQIFISRKLVSSVSQLQSPSALFIRYLCREYEVLAQLKLVPK